MCSGRGLEKCPCGRGSLLVLVGPFGHLNCLTLGSTSLLFEAKPSLKIGAANAICLNSLGLYGDYGFDHIFLRNKTFLFFKVEN